MHIQNHRAGADCLELGDGRGHDFADNGLYAQIDGKLHRLQRLVAGHAKRGQIGKALAVDVTFHAGNAAIVDIDVTDDMRSGRPAGIKAALFRAEADAWNAERQNLALLLRRQLAAQPLEARIGGKLLIGAALVEIRQNRPQLLDSLIDIDDAMRFGEKRDGANIGGQNLAIAVEKIGAGRHQAVGGCDARYRFLLGHAILHKTPANDGVKGDETENDQADAAFRLGGALLAGALKGRMIGVDAGGAGGKMSLALQNHDAGEKRH